jgi:uncharacterized protein (DUF1697 family)
MPTHAAFLRAVNLGGRRRALSSELRAALQDAGFDEVSTFRASGNVVLASRATERRLAAVIEEALAQRLGFSVEVYVRSAEELRGVIERGTSVAQQADASVTAGQVGFLRGAPSKAKQAQVLGYATEHDRLAVGDRELLWLRRHDAPRFDLNLRAIERLIGPWTMRTMETITQIVSRYFD